MGVDSANMTTWFVTRHPGALEWARRQGVVIDRTSAHLDLDMLRPGDIVLGTLPVHLAAQVCTRGAEFYNLSLDLPAEARGHELSADDLETFGARLEGYEVRSSGVSANPQRGPN